MDCIVHGVTKSPTQLSDFHFHFHSGWGPPPARGEMLASSLFGKGNLKATVWFKFSLKWHNHKQQGQKESSNTFASVIYCGYSSDVRHMHSENSLRLLELQWKKKKKLSSQAPDIYNRCFWAWWSKTSIILSIISTWILYISQVLLKYNMTHTANYQCTP